MLAALLVSIVLGQSNPLPVVEERYDAIAITADDYPRAYFVRDGKVIADRFNAGDWLWVIEGDSFVATWDDYGRCHRRVRCDAVIFGVETIADPAAGLPWWNAAQRMTDLKSPDE